MKITVIGLGYLGATTAVAFAKLGHQVIGIDPDESKVKALRAGSIPIYEPGLQSALTQALAAGNIQFSVGHIQESLDSQIHFLCVGTPQSKVGLSADTGYLFQAIDELLPFMSSESVIAGKSTVPVGTADSIIEHVKNLTGKVPNLVWNPEFLQEGKALEDSLYPNRIVIGSSNQYAAEVLKEFYKAQIDEEIPYVETDLRTAELVKVAANAFLATKISFINLMAEVAEVAGADTSQLATAIGFDDRIGSKFLKNGIGYGGGCLPKDLRSLVARAKELGLGDSVKLFEQVEAVNNRRRSRPMEIAKQHYGSLFGKKVLVLGASFKPDTDDIRDSPSLEVAELFYQEGAIVTIHDPLALSKVASNYPTLRTQSDINVAFEDKDVVVLGTEWPEYKSIDPTELSTIRRTSLLIDGRNFLDLGKWASAGWSVVGLGNGLSQPVSTSESNKAVA